ncbi:MAG: hypothetical protein ABSD92_04365 [Candidatus Bathyarchaeia archaeon]|jgi:hypothetical protein
MRKDKDLQTQKQQFDAVIESMDKELLSHSTNAINERKLGADMLPSEFCEHGTDSRDKSVNANPNFPKFSEVDRFSKEHDIDQNALKQNNGTPKFAKLDKPSDKKVKP